MTTTAVHRGHVHHRVPWLSIAVLIVAIAAAAIVLTAINQPTTTTTGAGTTNEAVVQPPLPPVPMPAYDNYALMRTMMLEHMLRDGVFIDAPADLWVPDGRHNFVEGM